MLVRIYSNQSSIFPPVSFEQGLNVILAEIRLPENQDRDTHNLGKTILGRLIDFCLLLGRDPKFFLFKNQPLFEEFIFFLVLQLPDDSFLTIRRSVSSHSKIAFKKHIDKFDELENFSAEQWDHYDVSFDRARELLDSYLGWRDLKPWTFRNILGYILRSQDDYKDVFQLQKFAGPHSDWKPLLAHLLGFNHKIVSERYLKEKELTEKQALESQTLTVLGQSVEDASKVEGLLLLKKRDAERKEELLSRFDFDTIDEERSREILDELDEQISILTQRRYSLGKQIKRIKFSIEENKAKFSVEDVSALFGELNIVFAGQIKKDFAQLVEFNKAITSERRKYLREELAELEEELHSVNDELSQSNQRRSGALRLLGNTDAFEKYRQETANLVQLKADIESLERTKETLHRLQATRIEIRSIKDTLNSLHTRIESDVEEKNSDKDSIFSMIRLYFSEIIEEVLDQKALLSVAVNKEAHLEFRAEILDETGQATSADLGHTYRKLLCIAFDMALLRAYEKFKFPRFVFHDGIFESLDRRKKENLLEVLRKFCDNNFQSIITLIDTDLPERADESDTVFSENEIALVLHDEGDQGRLFKIKRW